MGTDGTTTTLGKGSLKWGHVEVAVDQMEIIHKARVTPASLKFIFKDGHRVLTGQHDWLQVLPDEGKLNQLSYDLGLAGYSFVPVTVRVGFSANERMFSGRGATLGLAKTSRGEIELFGRNILGKWYQADPFLELHPDKITKFFQVLAHEVGHLVDYGLTPNYFQNSAIEREQRSEQYIRVRFGEEYTREIHYSYYKNRR